MQGGCGHNGHTQRRQDETKTTNNEGAIINTRYGNHGGRLVDSHRRYVWAITSGGRGMKKLFLFIALFFIVGCGGSQNPTDGLRRSDTATRDAESANIMATRSTEETVYSESNDIEVVTMFRDVSNKVVRFTDKQHGIVCYYSARSAAVAMQCFEVEQ